MLLLLIALSRLLNMEAMFQWAPTLGGECYILFAGELLAGEMSDRFNGHPPLGVNATKICEKQLYPFRPFEFQWAPTLWGECYSIVYLITPPPLSRGQRAS